MNNSNSTLIAAAFISGIINFAGIFEYYNMQNVVKTIQKPNEEEVMFSLHEFENRTYIDSTLPTEKEIVSDHISDVSSEADSSLQGKDEGLLPKAPIKDIFSQTERGTKIPPTPSIQQMEQIQKTVQEMYKEEEKARMESAFENKVSLIDEIKIEENLNKEKNKKENDKEDNNKKDKEDKKEKDKEEQKSLNPEEALESLQQTPINLQPSPPLNSKDDLFPLPMISIGDKTTSKLGIDSFDMTGSDLGIYLKKVREKLGLKFYQMIFFHYRSSFIFESKVEVSFIILKDGSIGKVDAKFIKGDPMFKDYCLTVINSSSPFAPLPVNIEPFLENDGTLKIDILFGYNVRE